MMWALAIIAGTIAMLAVAGTVKDTIDLHRAIKARAERDRAWRAYELHVIAEHERREAELEATHYNETEEHQ